MKLFQASVALAIGRKGQITAFSADELEGLKKVYNQSTAISKQMVRKAVERAPSPSLPNVIREIKELIRKEE